MKRFMAKVPKSFKGGQKGFTLIELLIVIVILGILAAAIIPNLSRFLGSGTVGAANAELAAVRTGIAAYQSEHDGALPLQTSTSVVDNDLIIEYMTGSNLIKADYTVGTTAGANDYGTIVSGNPDTTSCTGATAWNATSDVIEWDSVTDKWAKYTP